MGRKLKILVLMGGPSPEHEVSLNMGKKVCEGLSKRKYLISPLVIPKTGKWRLPRDKPDVAFIAMPGVYGEDGTLQKILEDARIPYTFSGVTASALGMDKPRSLAIFRDAGLNVPEFEVYKEKESRNKLRDKFRNFPLVVKPTNQGSSIGVHIIKSKEEFHAGVRDALRYSDRIMVQKFINGREITCGVLEKDGRVFPLPVMEILPKRGKFFDYKSKYDEGGSEHLIPPPGLSAKILHKIQDAASKAHAALDCSGASRTDFILSNDGKLYILEINTIPGMTSTSLLPEVAEAAGIDFSKLLDMIVQSAMRRSNQVGL